MSAALDFARQHLAAALDCLTAAARAESDAGRHMSETQMDCDLAAFKARGALAAVEQAIDRAKGAVRRRGGRVMTLDEFVNSGPDWPRGTSGFRVGSGRRVWTTADYPDRSNGERVRVSRIVHEDGETFSRVAFYDRDLPISFVASLRNNEQSQ